MNVSQSQKRKRPQKETKINQLRGGWEDKRKEEDIRKEEKMLDQENNREGEENRKKIKKVFTFLTLTGAREEGMLSMRASSTFLIRCFD